MHTSFVARAELTVFASHPAHVLADVAPSVQQTSSEPRPLREDLPAQLARDRCLFKGYLSSHASCRSRAPSPGFHCWLLVIVLHTRPFAHGHSPHSSSTCPRYRPLQNCMVLFFVDCAAQTSTSSPRTLGFVGEVEGKLMTSIMRCPFCDFTMSTGTSERLRKITSSITI